MKVITDYRDLVGKTIKFSHMAQFAEQITLVTTDNEVLMVTVDECSEVDLYNYYRVIGTIRSDKYLRDKMFELGVVDIEKWVAEEKKRQEEEAKKRKEEAEKKEYATYLKLKAKYENG